MDKIKKEDLIALKHSDILKAGDFIFDDFGKPMFKLGPNHKRIGTEYHSMFDMPVYRIKTFERPA